MFHAQGWATATVLIAKLGFGGLAQADTLDVPDEFATIQEAIDFATDGDEVVIAPGEYFENINFKGKAITVRSTDPTNPATILATIINGGGIGTVVTCNSGEGSESVLSGLLITNGSAVNGGGMLNAASNPTVSNCSFSANTAEAGAGMFNFKSSPTVTHCLFSENATSSTGGGGMFNSTSSPTVTDCTFSGNVAQAKGGGMNNLGNSNPTVSHCIFNANSASQGGGMYNHGLSNVTVSNCSFSGNSATEGGGVFNDTINTTMMNSVICRNTPDQLVGTFNDRGGMAISDDHCVPLPPGDTESDCERADLNGDGLVDPLDSGFVLARFGCQG